ncbi:MAG TPA: DMT family transporter [Bacteroidales bacterium]|nr:DMT family transporter [Bacteroidales bacterium]
MKRIAIVSGLLSGFLFGVATPLSKMLLVGFNSFQLAGLLYLGAALVMIPFVLKKNNRILQLFNSRSKYKTLGIIFFGGFLGPLLLLAGLNTANAASVSIWLNMELVATAILGIVFFKDTVDRYTWIGVILTVIAGIITSFGEGLSGITAALLITAACLCWGIDNHLTALTDGGTPQAVTFVKGLVAGSVSLGIGCMISNQSIQWIGASMALIVGAFSYGLSIVLYVTSSQQVGATRGQILFSTAPLWGVLLSYIFLHESFQWVHLFSIVLLTIAVILTSVITHNHLHTHVEMEHIHIHRHNDGHHHHAHDSGKASKGKWHTHSHIHEELAHSHTHYPDLHHRHNHP